MANQLPPMISRFIDTLESSYTICDYMFDSGSFGNMVLLLRSEHVCFRLVSDRDQWSIEIADPLKPDEWYDMALIISFMTESETDITSIDEQVVFALAELPRIEKLFEIQTRLHTHSNLVRLRKQRVRRRLPDFFK
ncbi:MAG: hypothetical protein VB050_15440 [Geobacteraceae bacterium]|nr:hypothetical protein [Geobacteraceae bacterium]